eukprot:TRINITY_DN45795_c0_g1_i1.p2 TRINITY_DN45795_c0_g1~~TRINITY_DN45795_c0_g1_i1.p2  ORF type:complete len:235 (-),score=26.80 TRINITY_DN45795_c0_g1_i1:83-787(-)
MPKESPFPWISADTVNTLYPYTRRCYIWSSWLLDAFFVRWIRAVRKPRLTDVCKSIGSGKVASVNIGDHLPKQPAQSAFVTKWGFVGDSQKQPYVKRWGGHGGFDKAVMLWSVDVIEEVNAEGHSCFPGSSGEQLTLSGVDWSLMKTGVRVEIGDSLLLELTYLKGPCENQTPFFAEKGKDGKRGRLRISPKRFPDSSRILSRVLRTGSVKVGDPVRIFEHPDGKQAIMIIDDS